MVRKTEILAVVQARGGSKSIPHKNIKLLNGIPLIAYSIVAGLQSKLVDRVIVSTDDAVIAEMAKQWGAEVPFVRPANISQDQSVDIELFLHALNWLAANEGYTPDIVVQLRPTSPFRPKDCVDKAIEVLLSNLEATSVRGIVECAQTPYKMWRIEDQNKPMIPLLKDSFVEPYNMLRQQLPKVYWQTGHIDVIRSETILKQRSMTGARIFPFLIDSGYSVDIDTHADWDWAEWVMTHTKLPHISPEIRHQNS